MDERKSARCGACNRGLYMGCLFQGKLGQAHSHMVESPEGFLLLDQTTVSRHSIHSHRPSGLVPPLRQCGHGELPALRILTPAGSAGRGLRLRAAVRLGAQAKVKS
uniref:Uncharacterized protein n=1 Tax=Leersia perrieri TaxID=77586 RepID=A0A0D9XWD6_9ORYZ